MAEPKRTLRLLNQESLPRLTGRCGRASWRLGPCRALHRVREGWPPEATQGDYSVRGKRTDRFRHSGLGDRAAVKIRYQFAWTARNVQCS